MNDKNIKEFLSKTLSKEKWERAGARKRAGILAPLFSVYSKESCGIGDFHDLKLLTDWLGAGKNSIIQLLPLNALGPLSCPYDSISSFALEPVYAYLGKTAEAKKLRREFPAGRPHVDYKIREKKIQALRTLFSADRSARKNIEKFIHENSYWAEDFALYKVIKESHQGKPWYEWPEEFKERLPGRLEAFRKEREEEFFFEIWLQWQLCEQLKEAKKYANERKIYFKGDLPLLVSRDSADVWAHPEFFKLELEAGAPPDMYSSKGQRWGMPTYNWDKVASDGYRYLIEKLKTAEQFYDILRIDHVVGLFRIWSVPYSDPAENQGLHGFFDPQQEDKWDEHGRKILTVMQNNTGMLFCAEDLGMIPIVCTRALEEFGIPGNDVQRWVKDWKVKHDFIGPADYRLLSVTMLSTHDTTIWPAWWENEAGTVDEGLFMRKCSEKGIDFSGIKMKLFDPARSRHGRLRWLDSVDSVDYLAGMLGRPRDQIWDLIDMYENTYGEKEKLWKQLKMKGPLQENAENELIKAVFNLTFESRAIFCIHSIFDWLSLAGLLKGDPYKYRINKPGTINEDNWSLTIPLPLEKLIKHKVTSSLEEAVISSGRAEGSKKNA
ncbi:MAG: 4-alpha-glucanotransferase [Candidatus Omnitrophica bacterium]|nr:4-alpha-glucanotransferase [Candidatus Omnitrophota bacterium]MDD5552886.1 4-alpha-glucanotransferase [Candidatus Omnitrophota bacterium]